MAFDIVIVFFFAFFIIAFLILIFSITLFQQIQSKKILKYLASENLRHSSIRFFQIHSSALAIRGGLSIRAEIYYNERLILICPKKNGWFNGLFNINLPVIFTTDINSVEKLTHYYNVFTPSELKFTKWNDLLIEYEKWMITKVSYNITIDFFNKAEIAEFPDIQAYLDYRINNTKC
jgi:hypothetical protein